MSMRKQFQLLLWKNYILKKRKILSSLLEILLPLVFSVVLISLRLRSKPVNVDAIKYHPIILDDLPSSFMERFPPGLFILAYIPKNDGVLKTIAENMVKPFKFRLLVKGYSSFEVLFKIKDIILCAVIFDHVFQNQSKQLPSKVEYSLRFLFHQRFPNFTYREKRRERFDGWNTRLLFPLNSFTGPRQPFENDGGLPGYFREGFLTIQHAINREIIYSSMNVSMIEQFKKINVILKRFPFPPYVQDPFISVLEGNLSLMIMLSFLCTCIFIIRSVVQEKEKKLKEYMCIMGLSNWLHWTAWFFVYFIILIIIILIMITLFFLKVKDNVAVLTQSDPSLVFLFLTCFAISTISFSFMISVFFSKANLAVAAGAIFYFFSYIPFLYIGYNYFEMSHEMKLVSCLLSNVAMSLGIKFIIFFEARGSGIQWRHVLKISVHDRLNFMEVMVMLLVDSVLYSLVTWYVEATFPGKYGIPQPWNFFMMRSYWLGKPHTYKEEPKDEIYTSPINPYVQDEPLDLTAGVKILNLSKVFRTGNDIKRALKNLTLNMYEGQITVLLGHNGAGKTTTLSILTGLFPPTSGEAWISGYEISEGMVQIRKSLGLCPQHDILFDHMTVDEHLTFYVQIKGSWNADFSDEINNILTVLGLEKKRHTVSQSLSGGMKRKLSIGISLIGGSKVVMMDEPTSGMDPVSRRAMWDLLQQEKSKRTIVLTTHFMDEADLLGDRIAILAKGKLQCCGSSLFLKQKYGAGYHMTIVKKQYCLVEEIERLIYEHIPSASMESNMGAELSFTMPKDNISRFEALFEELEDRQEELGISSFGASVTTMEEVFLRVSKFIDSNMDLQHINRLTSRNKALEKNNIHLDGSDIFHENFNYNNAFKLGFQQFYAMLVKKFSFTWCHWKMMLVQIIALLICITFTIKAFKISLESSKTPFLQLKLNVYGETTVPFFISKNTRLHPNLSGYVSDAIKAEEQLPMEISYPMDDFLINQATKDCAIFDENFLVAISFQDHKDKTTVTALFNNHAYHAAPMALAMVDNILYKLFFDSKASITTTNSPQPPPKTDAAIERLFQGPKGHFLAITLMFGISFLVSAFAILPISERVIKSKHIQFICGLSKTNYWLSSLLWDLLFFLFCSLLILLLLKILDEKAYIQKNHSQATLMMLMLFAWANIPLIYLMSFFFSGIASGCAKLIIINIVLGILPFTFNSIIKEMDQSLKLFSQKTDIVFQLIPNYSLAMAFSSLYYNYEFNRFCRSLKIGMKACQKIYQNYIPQENIYAWESLGIGKYLTSMAVCGFVYLGLLFCIDTDFLWKMKIYFSKMFEKRKLSQQPEETPYISRDLDVEEEKMKIRNFLPELLPKIPLIALEITKVYGHKKKKSVLAVDKVSLAIKKGECFGLLGLNGAGKTTTFKILTGDITITSGDAFINGKSISSKRTEIKKQIGYCPQFDALLGHMTGRQLLIMYARIWGIPEQQIQSYVAEIIFDLLLETQADRLVKDYSGGNKRKLSAGIALLGKPKIIFLDEPSTGMDPVARRLLWNQVTRAREAGKAIIITSHSMEECEALCTRLAIMVNGRFKCLGSPQHLKSKYGSGYTLLAKIKSTTPKERNLAIQEFKIFVQTKFPGSRLKDEHQGMVHYHLPKQNLKWSKVFGILENAKNEYKLDDYSISQVSLEQIFLSFAHLQVSLYDL